MRLLYIFILCLFAISGKAQRLTHDFQDTSLSEALIWINNAQNHYKLNFIFDELEDFTVTTSLQNASVRDAVRQVCGFYPMHLTFDEQEIYIECTQKADTKLSGHITNESSQPIAYASITLYSLSDSTFLTGGVSNEAGDFVIPCEASQVIARISCIGYKTFEETFYVGHVGKIHLFPDKYALKGVTVESHRTLHKLTSEGLKTTVSGTVLERLGSAEDVLAKIPGIIKKAEGYEVFGKGTPVFYINGRKVYDVTELTRLKAEDVKDISVISNPGSKYDATVKAVVLIKTKTPKGEGLGGTLQAQYQQSQFANLMSLANLTYRRGKLDISDAAYFAKIDRMQYAEISQAISGDKLRNQQMITDNHLWAKALMNTLSINYQLAKDHSIGMRYNMQYVFNSRNSNKRETNVWEDGEFQGHLYSDSKGHQDYKPKHELNGYYKGVIAGIEAEWNIDYLHDSADAYSEVNESSEDLGSRIVTSQNDVVNNMLASKLTLGWNFRKVHFTVGGEGISTVRNDKYINPEGYVATSNSKLEEKQISPFVEISMPYKYGTLTAGLRYEHVDFDYYEDDERVDAQSRSFSNLFPSFSANVRIGDAQFMLGYTAKTTRPTYRALSNNVIYLNRFSLQSGNSTLISETVHNLAFTGLWRGIQLQVSYNNRKDAIITKIMKFQEDISMIKPQNEESLKSLSVMLAYTHRIGCWTPKLSVGVYKQWFQLETGQGSVSFNSPVVSINASNMISLPKGWLFSVDAFYQSKGDSENASLTKDQLAFDVSLSKSFFKKKLFVELKGTDLTYGRTEEHKNIDLNIEHIQYNRYNTRALQITVRYNFNMMNSRYLGKGAGTEERRRMK